MSLSLLQQTVSVQAPRASLPQEVLTRSAVIPKVVPAPQAVSKGRSGLDKQTPEPAAESTQVMWSAQLSERANTPVASQSGQQDKLPSDRTIVDEQPPAKKSEIQLAMEQQIKDLLNTVWEASGKAVDFLLKRETGVLGKGSILGVTPSSPGGNEPLNANTSVASISDAGTSNTAEILDYTSKGVSRMSSQQASKGRMVNAVA